MAGKKGKTKVMEVAEELFREHGYASVTLQDIARELGIQKPSLYYHFPGGKEEMYLEVHRMMFQSHSEGLITAIATGDDLESRLNAIADWLLSHPPMFLMGMYHADLDNLTPTGRASMFEWSYRSIIHPVMEVFRIEQDAPCDPHIGAGMFLSAIESNVRGEQFGFAQMSAKEMTRESIKIIVAGWHGSI